MSEEVELSGRIEAIALAGGRYRAEAYLFVWDALGRTLAGSARRPHVSGAELLEGIRDLARERFGPMAKDVLNAWGVRATLDFGHIVFDLVAADLLRKTPEDSLADFDNRFDFQSVFEDDYFAGGA
ncbi:MAG: Minf_1886 family protein [Candidatus Krumholzibacteriia bacterium]